MSTKKIKITKAAVDRLSHGQAGRVVYWDSLLQGFGVRVSRLSKVYIAQKKRNGRPLRVTIGHHGQVTPDQARKHAQKFLGEMAVGKNPNTEKKRMVADATTLLDAFKAFMTTRKNLKPRTVSDYTKIMNIYFHNWQDRPLALITRDMIIERHKYIGEGHGGKAQADQAMRVLRAIMNFAMENFSDAKGAPIIARNPAAVLSKTRAWYKVGRRKTVIKPEQLPALFNALYSMEENNVSSKAYDVRDYILLLLFTGMRRSEGLKLQWDDVDFKSRTVTVKDTKNREDLTLPLSDFLLSVLKNRYEYRVNDYVFHGSGKAGHLLEPKRQLENIKKLSGVEFVLHDLRRTFITIAESLDIPYYAIKRLANHKIGQDVTAGYIVADVERLRKPMQQITDYILHKAGRKDAAKVIPLYKGGDY